MELNKKLAKRKTTKTTEECDESEKKTILARVKEKMTSVQLDPMLYQNYSS